LLLLEGAANNQQCRRVFALAVLGHPLYAYSRLKLLPRWQGGWTAAPPEQPMRQPLGTDGAPRELAGGKVVQGIHIMQGPNGQQVPVQLLGLV